MLTTKIFDMSVVPGISKLVLSKVAPVFNEIAYQVDEKG